MALVVIALIRLCEARNLVWSWARYSSKSSIGAPARPSSIAALATAGATVHRTLGIERLGDQVVGPELEPLQVVCPEHRVGDRLLGQVGQGPGGGDLHPLGDGPSPDVERSPEDEREAEHVVHLVGVVAAPGGHDHVVPCGLGVGIGDLGIGVGEGEDDRVGCHRLHHLLGDRPRHRDPDQRIGAFQGVGQSPGIGLDRELPS